MLIFTLLTVPVLLVILLGMERLEQWTVRVGPAADGAAPTDRPAEVRPVADARR